MRYYAEYDGNGKLIAIGTGDDGVEITEEEYNALLAEIQLKRDYALQVYQNQITLDEVPEEYRADVEEHVNALIEQEESTGDEISAEEALDIIIGGETV